MEKSSALNYFLAILVATVFGLFVGFSFETTGQAIYSMLNKESQLAAVAAVPVSTSSPVSAASANTTPFLFTQATTTITFVGDIMFDRGVRASAENNAEGDFNYLFKNIDKVKDTDILFGNLEGPVSDQGTDRHNLYSFRMLPEVTDIIKANKFKVLSFANNHVGDWGVPAFTDTLNRFEAAGIQLAGAGTTSEAASEPRIVVQNGIKFGFLACSDVGPNWLAAGTDTPGILLASNPNLPAIIAAAAKQVDVLIVSFHFGNEYQQTPSARQIMLAHLAIDNGAKVVVGHHPHVPETIEQYHGGLIMYSLGNFLFDQYFSKSTMSGLVVKVNFYGKSLAGFNKMNSTQDSHFRVIVE